MFELVDKDLRDILDKVGHLFSMFSLIRRNYFFIWLYCMLRRCATLLKEQQQRQKNEQGRLAQFLYQCTQIVNKRLGAHGLDGNGLELEKLRLITLFHSSSKKVLYYLSWFVSPLRIKVIFLGMFNDNAVAYHLF